MIRATSEFSKYKKLFANTLQLQQQQEDPQHQQQQKHQQRQDGWENGRDLPAVQTVPDVMHVRRHQWPEPERPDGPENLDWKGSGLCSVSCSLASENSVEATVLGQRIGDTVAGSEHENDCQFSVNTCRKERLSSYSYSMGSAIFFSHFLLVYSWGAFFRPIIPMHGYQGLVSCMSTVCLF